MSITVEIFNHTKRVSGVINNACCCDPGKGWFVFWVEDCFDPAIYLVRGESFQDAYDWFLTEKEHLLAVDIELDLDADDRALLVATGSIPGADWNDNGTLVWTESVQGVENPTIDWFHKEAA